MAGGELLAAEKVLAEGSAVVGMAGRATADTAAVPLKPAFHLRVSSIVVERAPIYYSAIQI